MYSEQYSTVKCTVQSQVLDGVVQVDTASPSNLEPCTVWNETEPCTKKFAAVKDRDVALSDSNTFTFRLSSESCQGAGEVSLELVDSYNNFNLTGRHLKYQPLPDHKVELGGGGEKCFRLSRHLCGPDSLSLSALQEDLVVTNCQGIVLMKMEHDTCG